MAIDYDVDANDDGMVDAEDWLILEGEAQRVLAVRLDAAHGERHWVGPLPLSAADRRLCTAVVRAGVGAVGAALLLALALALACRGRVC